MARARHRKLHRPMKVTTWLTAGATTVGVGAALLSGAAIANAKPSSDSSSSASNSSSSHSSGSSGSSSHKSHKHSPKKTDSGSTDSGSGSGSGGSTGSSGNTGSGANSGSSGSGSTDSSAGSAATGSSSDSTSHAVSAAEKTTKTKTSKAKHSNNKHAKTDTEKKSVSSTTTAASDASSVAPAGKHTKPTTKHVAAAATDAADTSTPTTSNNDASGSSSATAASALAAVSASATTASSTTTTGGTSAVKTTGSRTADFSGVLSVLAAVGQALSVSARNSELTLAAYAHNTELTLTHDLVGTAHTINAAAAALAAGFSSLTTVPAASATSTASTATTAASTEDDADTSLYAGTSSDPQVAQALTEIQAAQAAYNAAVKKSWWASFTNGMAGYYLQVAKKDLLKYQANQDNLLAAYTANPTTKNYNALAANEKLTTSAYSALKSAASSSSISALKTNAKAASTDAHIYGTVSMSLYLGTEAIVKISINGGPMSKVLLDSGSTGLVIAAKYVGDDATMTSTGSGTSAYGTGSGDTGVTFNYTTYTTSVSFGSGITGDAVTVNVVSADTQSAFLKYIGQDGVVGVLGIGTNAVDNQVPVTSGLLGELGNGVYINEKTKTVTFGPNPLPVRVTASGTPNSTGYISVDGGNTLTPANFILDSGGVYGTITAGAAGDAATSTGYLAVGTVVSVYNSDGTKLYSYTVTKTNSPTVTADASTTQTTVDGVTAYAMNSGYQGFALGPVYIDYLNGTTTITDSEGNVSSYVGETDYDLWTS